MVADTVEIRTITESLCSDGVLINKYQGSIYICIDSHCSYNMVSSLNCDGALLFPFSLSNTYAIRLSYGSGTNGRIIELVKRI